MSAVKQFSKDLFKATGDIKTVIWVMHDADVNVRAYNRSLINALFNGDMAVATHCIKLMAASDEEIAEETKPYLTERGCLELWQYAKARLSEACALLSTQSESIPIDRYDQAVQQLCGDLAWYFGLQMRDKLLSDPRAKGLEEKWNNYLERRETETIEDIRAQCGMEKASDEELFMKIEDISEADLKMASTLPPPKTYSF